MLGAEKRKTGDRFLCRPATYLGVCRPISESIRQDMALGPRPPMPGRFERVSYIDVE